MFAALKPLRFTIIQRQPVDIMAVEGRGSRNPVIPITRHPAQMHYRYDQNVVGFQTKIYPKGKSLYQAPPCIVFDNSPCFRMLSHTMDGSFYLTNKTSGNKGTYCGIVQRRFLVFLKCRWMKSEFHYADTLFRTLCNASTPSMEDTFPFSISALLCFASAR